MRACRKQVYTYTVYQSDCQTTTPPVMTNSPIFPRMILRDKRELMPRVSPPVARYDTGSRGRNTATIQAQDTGSARGMLYRSPKVNEAYMDMLDNV